MAVEYYDSIHDSSNYDYFRDKIKKTLARQEVKTYVNSKKPAPPSNAQDAADNVA